MSADFNNDNRIDAIAVLQTSPTENIYLILNNGNDDFSISLVTDETDLIAGFQGKSDKRLFSNYSVTLLSKENHLPWRCLYLHILFGE
ncbi:MAG: hypothetical protein JXJ04_07680 [Spirochaetales bacterium]|nr:hypothetical protein [Spirochaetales bacterium]